MQRPSRSSRPRHAAITTVPARWNTLAARPRPRERSRRRNPGDLAQSPRPAPAPARDAAELTRWMRVSGPPPQPTVLESHRPRGWWAESCGRVAVLSRAARRRAMRLIDTRERLRSAVSVLRHLGVRELAHGSASRAMDEGEARPGEPYAPCPADDRRRVRGVVRWVGDVEEQRRRAVTALRAIGIRARGRGAARWIRSVYAWELMWRVARVAGPGGTRALERVAIRWSRFMTAAERARRVVRVAARGRGPGARR